MTEFLSPRALRAGDRVSEFHCGVDSLDIWIRGRARNNEKTGASRTMVSTTRDGRVAGYYCLSASSLVREESPSPLGKGQPNPIPVVLLGRLAVDQDFAGRGLGVSLLQHATLRSLEAAATIGIRAMMVNALSDDVVPFYERYGFTRFPGQSHALYLLASDARATLDSL